VRGGVLRDGCLAWWLVLLVAPFGFYYAQKLGLLACPGLPCECGNEMIRFQSIPSSSPSCSVSLVGGLHGATADLAETRIGPRPPSANCSKLRTRVTALELQVARFNHDR